MINAISGTRRQMKELVDGTIRLTVDISPVDREQFWALFPSIDMPVALAPLVADFEHKSEAQIEAREMAKIFTGTEPIQGLDKWNAEQKGGALCKLAAILCNDPKFQKWIAPRSSVTDAERALSDEEFAATRLRSICNIDSRRELDHNPKAARIFEDKIRRPWLEYQGLA